MADLAGYFEGDDAIGCDEGVDEGGFAVVDVREDSDVVDVRGGVLQGRERAGRDGGHFGGCEGGWH